MPTLSGAVSALNDELLVQRSGSPFPLFGRSSCTLLLLLRLVYSLIDVLLSIRLEGLAVAMVHVARPIDYSTRLANAGKESHPRPMFLSSTQEEPNQYSSLGLPNLTSEHCSTIRACNAIYTKRALIA